MTLNAQHGDRVLQQVMAIADSRRDGGLPWDEIDGIAEVFGSQDDLLHALQMRWHTRLSGAIERMLSVQPDDLPLAVAHAWRTMAAEMPGVRRVLDAYADDETLRSGRHKEWVLLASASGLAGLEDTHAVDAGREVEQRARSVSVVKTPPPR